MGMIRIFMLLLAIINLTDAEKEDLEFLIEGLRSYEVKSMIGHVTTVKELSPYGKRLFEEEAKEEVKKREALLRKDELGPSISSEWKKEIFLALEGEKIRCDVRDSMIVIGAFEPFIIWKRETAYDGEKVMVFRYGPGLATSAYIYSKSEGIFWVKGSHPLVRGGIPFPLDSLLEKKVNGSLEPGVTVKRVYKEELDGESCYAVEIEKVRKFPEGDQKIEDKFWIVPQKCFKIKRREWINKYPEEDRIKMIKSVVRVTLDKYDEFWFPRKIVKEVFYKEGEEWKSESKTTTYLHDDLKINVDVPDSIFCIKLPEGLKWFDTRIGMRVD